jgi:hypothetical protein
VPFDADWVSAAAKRVGKIVQDFCDPSGSLANLRLAVPFDLVALRAA